MLRSMLLLVCLVGLLSGASFAQSQQLAGVPSQTVIPVPAVDGATFLREASRHLSQVAAEVNPAVVHIESRRDGRSGELVEETGSGVVMRSPKFAGVFVVTNRHVVHGSVLSKVDIHLADGRILHPVRVLEDLATDLAVLLLSETNVPAAKWGDSDNLDIGHFVIAVGSPFGLSQSVTMGIISAKGRRSLELGGPREVINQDFLQTDAAINPGNSGGPLIDLYGHVVGINTAIASESGGNEGIGFSIPSNLVRYVADELLENGKVHRGYLGVKLDNDFTMATAGRLKLDRLRGARVLQVYTDTPAYKAGLLLDDVIVNFDGLEIEDESHLIHRVSLTPVNKTVRVVVIRNGVETTLHVTLTERPADSRAEPAPARAPSRVYPGSYRHAATGLTVHRVTATMAAQAGYAADVRGLLVAELPRGDESGLSLYDVIEEVARTPVQTLDEFDAAVAEYPTGPLVLKVRRIEDGRATSRIVIWTR
jgi:serine protease Do